MSEHDGKDIWKPTCDRFVAYMDIMGFRDMVYRNSHAKVMRMMKTFKNPIREIERDFEERAKKTSDLNIYKNAVVKPVIFSDSVVLFSNDDSPMSLQKIMHDVLYLFSEALADGIPMKGAIAHGRQTADLKESLYFGRPLIDAWELQNELYMYGVILHHTVEKYKYEHEEECGDILDEYFWIYEVPMKQGSITHYTMDWLDFIKFLNETNEDIDVQSTLQKLYCEVSGSVRMYVDNTKNYAVWVEQQNKTV